LGFGPENISTYGGAIDSMYFVILALTGITFIGVELALVVFMIQYRQGSGARVRGDVEGNNKLELLWTAIPAGLMALVAFGGQSLWATIRDPNAIPDDAVPIEVSARQFAWDIRYTGPDGKFGKTKTKLITEENPFGLDPEDAAGKDDIISDSIMCVPVGRAVKVSITSKDVIHSFFLPNVRIKQDAVPGMTVDIWFQVTKTTNQALEEWKKAKTAAKSIEQVTREVAMGLLVTSAEAISGKGEEIVGADSLIIDVETCQKIKAAGVKQLKVYPDFDFQIVCAELCGNAHFKMKGTLKVETLADFEQWLKDNAPS